jgi:hypothetical protein
MKIYRIIENFVFVIGLMFITTLIHEYIHYLQCGGDFIAGFYWIKSEWGVGVTYCSNGDASELLAYSLSSIFTIIVFTIRLKIDRINYDN